MTADTSSWLWDVVSFRVLISPAVLLVMYYVGAIIVPVLIIWFMRSSWRQAKNLLGDERLRQVRTTVSLDRKSRSGLLLGSVLMFLVLELFWRMMFEFLIAYFQMHNALMVSAGV